MKTKNLALSLLAVAFMSVLAFTLWYSGTEDGLASVANLPARIYLTKGDRLKGDKGYAQVVLEIDKKKGATTIGEKVHKSPKKRGLEE